MEQPPVPPERERRAIRDGRRMVGDVYGRADGLITFGEGRVFRLLWFFIPEASIARSARFQYILASTFLSDAARDAVKYGALIAVVRGGGSALDAALVGVAALVPAALLGLYGGAVADELPKRLALAIIYALQAAVCIVVPLLLGTGLAAILFLVFAINTFGQVSGPTEQSIAPLVASDAELASATSMLSLASNLGTVFGTTLMAPILVRLFGARAVFYLAGALLFVASGRVLHLHSDKDRQRFELHRPRVDTRATITWLVDQPAVATMIVVAVLAGTANLVLQTLAPRYVQAVLDVDPADSVYVFAPSAAGLAIALAASPRLIKLAGERLTALSGFVIVAAALCALGLVDHGVARLIDPINPMRLLDLIGVSIGSKLRTAALLVLPLGFGMSLTTMAVQTYINRRVPLSYQGRAFALQSTLKNGATIVPLLTLGAAASVFGVGNVLIASPVLLVAIALALVQLSLRFSGRVHVSRIDVLQSFWEEPPPTPTAAPPP